MTALESVRVAQSWKVSDTAEIEKCQNPPNLESFINSSDLSVSQTARTGKCQKWFKLESVRNALSRKVF